MFESRKGIEKKKKKIVTIRSLIYAEYKKLSLHRYVQSNFVDIASPYRVLREPGLMDFCL